MESSNLSPNITRSSTSTTTPPRRSTLLQPSQMVESSYETDQNPMDISSISSATSSSHRSFNHQRRLIHRSEDNCPIEIHGSKLTGWHNTGKKAKQNFAVISSVPPFDWPTVHYDAPIFINRCTTELILISSVQRIADVHVFMIDTESDFLPAEQSSSQPALLQIQAIHNEDQATVFLVEAQHLPPPSSTTFARIQHLCHTIFSPNNEIIAWGDVRHELSPFANLHLLDISRILKATNLQNRFTKEWNQHHPHTSDCIVAMARASTGKKNNNNNVLISAILQEDTDEDDNDFGEVQIIDKFSDSNHCICPPTSRPYKARNAKWQLQRAIHLCFNRALDKSLTLQIWSCGLDPALNPSLSPIQRAERDQMILYAINDVFAPTHLYFYLRRQNSSLSDTSSSIPRSTISSFSSPSSTTTARTDVTTRLLTTTESISSTFLQSNTSPPLIVIVADSHFKFLPSNFITNSYHLSNYVKSGLSWLNPYDSNLCATTLLQSDLLSSSLSLASAVFLFIGTNSLRVFPADSVIDQVQKVILHIHSTYPHLTSTSAITINHTFPTAKLTTRFRDIHELSANITKYNDMLTSLSKSCNFSILKFPILLNHLYSDGIHVRHRFNNILSNTLYRYIHHLIPSFTSLHSNQPPTPSINIPEIKPVVPSSTTSNSDPSLLNQDAGAAAEIDVVEINVPSDEELDPSNPLQPDLVKSHLKSKSSKRSAEAKQKRNRKRHEQQKQQYKNHPLRRRVHPSWEIPQIRDFLTRSNIPFGCVNPRRGTVVTILFSNEEQRRYADRQLTNDIFDELHYTLWTTNQSQD